MVSICKSAFYIYCLLMFLLCSGCGSSPARLPGCAMDPMGPLSGAAAPNTILIYFIRHANFSGGGRSHILKIDGRTIGPLTADNFYRLEMWPGQYHFSVFMPREEFFGQISVPANVSRQITLKPTAGSNVYICSYTDGLGSSGISLDPILTLPADLTKRTMADDLKARETAQVKHLFGARYDGPARYGRPHGKGRLSWSDGSVYKGTFEHGIATPKARFHFPNGHIFMGPNHQGRPGAAGILMGADGRILFAGRFVGEQPHGTGLRNGMAGPEFCTYNHGVDITKTFRRRAKAHLDIEERQQISAFVNGVGRISDEISMLTKRLTDLTSRHDPDQVVNAVTQIQKKIKALNKDNRRAALNLPAETKAFMAQLQDSRYQREIAMTRQLRKLHDAEIEKERQWCHGEFNQGHNLCICAPFAENFQQWQECRELLRTRYMK
jgi:hypothetical protein